MKMLRSAFPNDTFLGEEGGGNQKSVGRRWLVDPLDGTTNFAHSYPFFCVSIALEIDGELSVGIVYNPISDELFTAEKGEGAFLNDRPIHVSDIPTLDKSLLATGFPPDTAHAKNSNLEAFTRFTDMSHGVRRDGSAALDLSYVACGRLEAFWEFKLAPWDIGAGALIVTEAGGTVSDTSGSALDISTGHIIASNGQIHREVVASLEAIYGQSLRRV